MKEKRPSQPFDSLAEPAGPESFQPFQDRLSRDIRNGLSRALSRALAEGDMAPVEILASSLLCRNLGSCYCNYIKSRLERYRQAFAQIRAGKDDPLRHGLILWNLQLFFEVHEVLEHAWLHAQGRRKLLLQAMIRAAGVYIKLEYGYRRQAAKMAAKAGVVLEEEIDVLRGYFEPEELLAALRDLSSEPPTLVRNEEKDE